MILFVFQCFSNFSKLKIIPEKHNCGREAGHGNLNPNTPVLGRHLPSVQLTPAPLSSTSFLRSHRRVDGKETQAQSTGIFFFFCWLCMALENEPGASDTLGKHSTTEPHLQWHLKDTMAGRQQESTRLQQCPNGPLVCRPKRGTSSSPAL